jgi:hypothetical protein
MRIGSGTFLSDFLDRHDIVLMESKTSRGSAGAMEMTQVQADTVLTDKLYGLGSPIEIRNSQGVTVGHYLPEEEYLKLLYASFKMPFSEEEIARRRSETGGRTLEEIWSRLGQS